MKTLGAILLVLAAGACAGVKSSGTGQATGNGTGTGGRGASDAGPPPFGGFTGNGRDAATVANCVNLQCQQTTCTRGACQQQPCAAGQQTTVSGTIFDPAGRVPLYNVIVYVPNRVPDAIPEGVTCDKCAGTATGGPIASALTDPTGHFVLDNAPVGANIPLVIQIGKWRRQITVPNVAACTDTPITDPNLTHLPRNKTEGHIPQIGLTTGGSDALECFLRKIGIADSEFTTEATDGRVHMYAGGRFTPLPLDGQGAINFAPALGGATLTPATALWGSVETLMKYDILLLSCEGSQFAEVKEPLRANIKAYADAGGRLFNDHLHAYWLRFGPSPWPITAMYVNPSSANPPSPSMGTVDTTFPKGAALADWLVAVNASTTRGQIQLYDAQHTVELTLPPTQRWIYVDQTPTLTEYMTFNTPVGVPDDNQCGRVVETDIHVKAVDPNQNGKDDSDPTKPFPTGCLSTVLSPQEKALEFLFFDLSSCIIKDSVPPQPPPIVP